MKFREKTVGNPSASLGRTTSEDRTDIEERESKVFKGEGKEGRGGDSSNREGKEDIRRSSGLKNDSKQERERDRNGERLKEKNRERRSDGYRNHELVSL